MNYAKLKTELQDDPLNRGYATLLDAAAADSLNVKNRPQVQPLLMRGVIRWAAIHDAIYVLEQAAASGTKDKRKLAKAALVMLQSPHVPDLDLADTEIAAMFDALVALGVFTAEQKAELVMRATVQISRAEELGLGAKVKPGHVQDVRR